MLLCVYLPDKGIHDLSLEGVHSVCVYPPNKGIHDLSCPHQCLQSLYKLLQLHVLEGMLCEII